MSAIAANPAAVAVPRRPRRRRLDVRRVGARLLIVGATAAGLLGIWYAVDYLVLAPHRRFLLPPPHEIVTESVLQWDHLQPMLSALGNTARVALIGLVIAVLLGTTMAVVMAQGRRIESVLYPYAVMVQTVPILAIVPLLGIWFGYDFRSRLVVVVIIAFFPIVSNTTFGLKSVDRGLQNYFTMNRAGRVQRLLKLQFPAALPSFMTGLQQAAGLSVIGSIVGDTFFRQGEPGIGTLLDVYRARLNSHDLFTAIILSSLFGVTVFSVFRWLTRAVVGSWHASEHD